MFKFTLVFSVLFSFTFLNAQTPGYKWGQVLGLDMNSVTAYKVDTDVSNNIYITGWFTGSVDFDQGPNVYELTSNVPAESAFVLKIDASGLFQWCKVISGTGNTKGLSIKTDPFGDVVVAGTFGGICNFGTTSQPYIIQDTTPSFNDQFVLKLDSSGNLVWVFSNNTVHSDLALDDYGNIYYAGYFQGITNLDHTNSTYPVNSASSTPFLVSLDALGEFNWAKSWITNTFGMINCIASDNSGNIVSIGRFQDSIQLDLGNGNTPVSVNDSGSVFMHKHDINGNQLWAKTMGSSVGISPIDVNINGIGEIYLAGGHNGGVPVNFSSNNSNSALASGTNMFLAKFSMFGNHQWSYGYGGTFSEGSEALTIDKFNNVYVAGRAVGGTDLDPTAQEDLIEGYGYLDAFVFKIDNNDNYSWHYAFGGPEWDAVHGIVVDSIGDIISVGHCVGNIDIDPSVYEDYYINNGNSGGFIQKMGQCFYNNIDLGVSYLAPNVIVASQLGAYYQWLDCDNNFAPIPGAVNMAFGTPINGSFAVRISYEGCQDTSSCYIVSEVSTPVISNEGISFFPNPVINDLTITAQGGAFEYSIHNYQGRIVKKGFGDAQLQINLNLTQSSGVYFINVIQGEKSYFDKIILR